MDIGFTGTSQKITKQQYSTIKSIIVGLVDFSIFEINKFRHGDCVGGDATFHDICVALGFKSRIVIHPGFPAKNPSDLSMRAWCDAPEIRQPKNFFSRNRDIVNESDIMISAPRSRPMPKSGGTRYTTDFAKDANKLIYVVYPDGGIVNV